MITILIWDIAVDAVAYRWARLSGILKSRPRPLIHDGRPNRKVMRRELMTDEELLSQLRLQGIEDVVLVQRAYIEPNGMISVMRRDGGETEAPEPPRRPGDAGLATSAPATRRRRTPPPRPPAARA